MGHQLVGPLPAGSRPPGPVHKALRKRPTPGVRRGRRPGAGPHPWELPVGFEGRRKAASWIAAQETAVRTWVAEVGREMRDVERQISFFRARVESKIRWEAPVEEKCRRCGKT